MYIFNQRHPTRRSASTAQGKVCLIITNTVINIKKIQNCRESKTVAQWRQEIGSEATRNRTRLRVKARTLMVTLRCVQFNVFFILFVSITATKEPSGFNLEGLQLIFPWPFWRGLFTAFFVKQEFLKWKKAIFLRSIQLSPRKERTTCVHQAIVLTSMRTPRPSCEGLLPLSSIISSLFPTKPSDCLASCLQNVNLRDWVTSSAISKNSQGQNQL